MAFARVIQWLQYPFLPASATPGHKLVVDADGRMTDVADTGSGAAEADVTHTTASLANGASEDFTLAVGKLGVAKILTTDRAAWVRLYRTAAARTADSSRVVTDDPLPGTGVLFDFTTTAGTLTIGCSPPVWLTNGDDPPTSTIYGTVTNLGSTGTVTVTLTATPVEI